LTCIVRSPDFLERFAFVLNIENKRTVYFIHHAEHFRVTPAFINYDFVSIVLYKFRDFTITRFVLVIISFKRKKFQTVDMYKLEFVFVTVNSYLLVDIKNLNCCQQKITSQIITNKTVKVVATV
jgi:hypothetical protein